MDATGGDSLAMTRLVGIMWRLPREEDFVVLQGPHGRRWLLPVSDVSAVLTPSRGKIAVSFGMMVTAHGRARPTQIMSLQEESDFPLLKACFKTPDCRFWRPVLGHYFSALTDDEIIEDVAEKVRDLSVEDRIALLSQVPEHLFYVPAASQIWAHLPEGIAWKLIGHGLDQKVSISVLREIRRQIVDGNFDIEQKNLWRARGQKLRPGTPEFKLLPRWQQEERIRYQYSDVVSCWRSNTVDPIFYLGDLPNLLNDQDQRLAENWMSQTITSTEPNSSMWRAQLAKMLSARTAEKVAALFYRQLGHDVVDVSLEQLQGGTDWQTHDLLLDQQIPVDVKNARLPFNSSSTYVEHIVPAFKRSRAQEKVRIVGVLSPYLRLEEFRKGAQGSTRGPGKITVLGELSLDTVLDLDRRFATSNVTCDLSRYISVSEGPNQRRAVIPPWLFDYPPRFYESSHEGLQAVHQRSDEELPVPEMWRMISAMPLIGLLLAARRPLPEGWRRALREWQWDFYHQLIEFNPLTRPALFLSILNHFTEAVRNPPRGYSPRGYQTLLYFDAYGPFPELNDLYPAGLYDPLKLISGLCLNLDALWTQRKFIGLREFDEFRFQGLGILRAKRKDESRWITLFAYCGGETKSKVKCGYPDLVLGRSGIGLCPDCGRLICPKCGFCRYDCPAYRNRLGRALEFLPQDHY